VSYSTTENVPVLSRCGTLRQVSVSSRYATTPTASRVYSSATTSSSRGHTTRRSSCGTSVAVDDIFTFRTRIGVHLRFMQSLNFVLFLNEIRWGMGGERGIWMGCFALYELLLYDRLVGEYRFVLCKAWILFYFWMKSDGGWGGGGGIWIGCFALYELLLYDRWFGVYYRCSRYKSFKNVHIIGLNFPFLRNFIPLFL